MGDKLSDLGEDVLFEKFRKAYPAEGKLIVGPGDDCAVVAGDEDGWDMLLKTDALVEGIHYKVGEKPELVGRKALSRVLSDIGAMGGSPQHLLITLALPKSTEMAWIDGFYSGLDAMALWAGCQVAGGEMTGLPEGCPIVVSISATGRVESGKAVLRSGGNPGDVLAVTGILGGSFPSRHHLEFKPRLREGRWLAGSGAVNAMMDLSDGLAKDLPRLAKASKCEFVIDASRLPIRDGFNTNEALGDGEDYELLIAVDSARWKEVNELWKREFPNTKLTEIGKLVPAGEGSGIPLAGWDHFAE